VVRPDGRLSDRRARDTSLRIPRATGLVIPAGILDFDVQYFDGAAWVTVPRGSVTGNDKAWSQFTFPAVTTTKIRVVVTNARNYYSRIVQLEAFGTSALTPETPAACEFF